VRGIRYIHCHRASDIPYIGQPAVLHGPGGHGVGRRHDDTEFVRHLAVCLGESKRSQRRRHRDADRDGDRAHPGRDYLPVVSCERYVRHPDEGHHDLHEYHGGPGGRHSARGRRPRCRRRHLQSSARRNVGHRHVRRDLRRGEPWRTQGRAASRRGGGPDTGSIIPGTRSACVSELAQFPLTTNNFAPAGSGPNGITSGPGSNTNSLWFTLQFANQIGEISTDGTFLQSFTVPTPASQPYGIVAGSDGDIYFTEYVGGKVGAPKIPTELASQR